MAGLTQKTAVILRPYAVTVRRAALTWAPAAFSDTFQISTRIRGRETLVQQRHQEDRSGHVWSLGSKDLPGASLEA
jgi:hypothetical protein